MFITKYIQKFILIINHNYIYYNVIIIDKHKFVYIDCILPIDGQI